MIELKILKVDAGDKVRKDSLLATIFHNDLVIEKKMYKETARVSMKLLKKNSQPAIQLSQIK